MTASQPSQGSRLPLGRRSRLNLTKRRFGAAILSALAGYVVIELTSEPAAEVSAPYSKYASNSKTAGAKVSSGGKSKSYEKPHYATPLHRILCADANDPSRGIASDTGLGLFSGAAVFSLGRRFLTCETYSGDATGGDMSFPASDGAADTGTPDYANPSEPGGNPGTPEFEENVAYVVTIASCPEDTTQPALLREGDPGADGVFYDAAAVLQHGVCQCSKDNPDSGSAYNHTVYAVVHPDAVNCAAPASSPGRRLQTGSTYYNRVKMLEDLGYWVKIYENPLELNEIPSDANAYLKANVENDAGIRDLMKLHAYRFTGHALAVVLDWDSMMKAPLDVTFDALKADANKVAVYGVDAATQMLDDDVLIVKPDAAEFEAIKTAYKTTTYDASTGWGGTGEGVGAGGMGLKGFLKHYYKNVKGAAAAEEVDIKGTGNVAAFDAACGKPWQCKYDEALDTGTQSVCQDLNSAWYAYRYGFEQAWNMISTIDLSVSQYHRDHFLGYCTDDSANDGYTGILDALPPTTLAPTDVPTPSPVTPAPVLNVSPTPAPVDSCNQVDSSRYNICLDFEPSGATYQNGDWTADTQSGAAKWESVIVGDLPSSFSLAGMSADNKCPNLPAAVDDMYICAKDPEIDGQWGTLGSAGPTWGLSWNAGQSYMPVAGKMQFDAADMDYMMGTGIWGEVVKHEIGHILGIGTLWDQPGWGHDLVHTSSLPFHYKNKQSNACQQWRAITGCAVDGPNACPPIEEDGGAGTAGGHWDETIMGAELMSGYAEDGTSPLSKITVGMLQDLGYSVDYGAADAYALACPSGGRRRLQEEEKPLANLESGDGGDEGDYYQEKGKLRYRTRAVAVRDESTGKWRRLSAAEGSASAAAGLPPHKRRLNPDAEASLLEYAQSQMVQNGAECAETQSALEAANPGLKFLCLGDHALSVYGADENGNLIAVDVIDHTDGGHGEGIPSNNP